MSGRNFEYTLIEGKWYTLSIKLTKDLYCILSMCNIYSCCNSNNRSNGTCIFSWINAIAFRPLYNRPLHNRHGCRKISVLKGLSNAVYILYSKHKHVLRILRHTLLELTQSPLGLCITDPLPKNISSQRYFDFPMQCI